MSVKLAVNNDNAGRKFADLLKEKHAALYQPGQFDPAVNVMIDDGYPEDFVIEDAVKILKLEGYEALPTRFNSAGCSAGNVRVRRYSDR